MHRDSCESPWNLSHLFLDCRIPVLAHFCLQQQEKISLRRQWDQCEGHSLHLKAFLQHHQSIFKEIEGDSSQSRARTSHAAGAGDQHHRHPARRDSKQLLYHVNCLFIKHVLQHSVSLFLPEIDGYNPSHSALNRERKTGEEASTALSFLLGVASQL